MKHFEENRAYNLFGYDVKLVDCGNGNLTFLIVKGRHDSKISFTVDLSFLKEMDSTETRRLELLFRDLENFAKFGDSEE